MAHPKPPQPPPSKKRKEPPTTTSSRPNKSPKLSRQRDARVLSTQTTSKAFQHGALDVDKFVRAREYEIRALERGLQRSKKANHRRAFQLVPRELRRRTASHDVKRVPKRLRGGARREVCTACLNRGGYGG